MVVIKNNEHQQCRLKKIRTKTTASYYQLTCLSMVSDCSLYDDGLGTKRHSNKLENGR